VFSRDLLNAFEAVVNAHSGILPDYCGVAATEWSVYRGERTTGYAFHYMTELVDGGPVLADGEVAVDGRTVEALEYEKALMAADQLEMVLRSVIRGERGAPQEGKRMYFGPEASRLIRTIEIPSDTTWKELQRRLAAFGTLWIRLDRKLMEVSRLRRLRDSRNLPGARTFFTADGIPVTAIRFGYLPLWLYRLIQPRTNTANYQALSAL
jgi:methionyl-tRNA formyltransferase